MEGRKCVSTFKFYGKLLKNFAPDSGGKFGKMFNLRYRIRFNNNFRPKPKIVIESDSAIGHITLFVNEHIYIALLLCLGIYASKSELT